MTNHRRRMQTRTRLQSGSRFVEPWAPLEHNRFRAHQRTRARIQRRIARTYGVPSKLLVQRTSVLVEAFGHVAAAAAKSAHRLALHNEATVRRLKAQQSATDTTEH